MSYKQRQQIYCTVVKRVVEAWNWKKIIILHIHTFHGNLKPNYKNYIERNEFF